LTVTSLRTPLLVHGGFLGWGAGYTYYYSLTDMRANGTLTIAGRRIPVHGIAWMDHQWGDMENSSVHGWDWMALQLGDHTQINMVNERAGSPTYPFRQWAQALLPNSRQVFVPTDVTITPLGRWRSPHTGTLYPSGWHVRIPRLQLDVVVRPTMRDQEMVDRISVSGYRDSYWEGSCTVVGTRAGHRVSGKAYAELTGYGSPPPATQV
jgi:predicted secreted hydrolase